MNDRDRKAAVYALQQARQGIEVALSMLEGAEAPQTCQHPRRQDTSGMGGGDSWYCPDCKMEVRDGKVVAPGKHRADAPPPTA